MFVYIIIGAVIPCQGRSRPGKTEGAQRFELAFESKGFGIRRTHWTDVSPFFIGKGGDWRHGCDTPPPPNENIWKRNTRKCISSILGL